MRVLIADMWQSHEWRVGELYLWVLLAQIFINSQGDNAYGVGDQGLLHFHKSQYIVHRMVRPYIIHRATFGLDMFFCAKIHHLQFLVVPAIVF